MKSRENGLMSTPSRRQQLEAMLVETPDDAELRYFLAMEHASQGDDTASARLLDELTQASPDYVPAYLQLGQVLLRLGRDSEARAGLERGLSAARRCGNDHAFGEMQQLLQGLED
jgi:thioredoxin-like negative regulator of GroEL